MTNARTFYLLLSGTFATILILLYSSADLSAKARPTENVDMPATRISVDFTPHSFRPFKDDPSLVTVEGVLSIDYQLDSGFPHDSAFSDSAAGRYVGVDTVKQLLKDWNLPVVDILGDLQTTYLDGVAIADGQGHYNFSWIIRLQALALGDFRLFPFDAHRILLEFTLSEPCQYCQFVQQTVEPEWLDHFGDGETVGSEFRLMSFNAWSTSENIGQKTNTTLSMEFQIKRIIVSVLLAGVLPQLIILGLVVLIRYSPHIKFEDVIKISLTMVIALAANIIAMDHLVPDGNYLTLFNLYSLGVLLIGFSLLLSAMFKNRANSKGDSDRT